MPWNWKFSPLPGIVAQVLNVPARNNIFYAAVAGADNPEDNGLYQSLDNCSTWRQIYSGFHARALYYQGFTNELLVGGLNPVAEKNQILYFGNANAPLDKAVPKISDLPAELYQVMNMDGWQPNAFTRNLYVAQAEGVAYTENYTENPVVWKTLTQAAGDLPGESLWRISVVKTEGFFYRLYLCGFTDEDSYSYFAASEVLALDEKPVFKVCFQNDTYQDMELLVVNDSCHVGESAYIQANFREGPGAAADLLRSENVPNNPNWSIDVKNLPLDGFNGRASLATMDATVFVRTASTLAWYTRLSEASGSTDISKFSGSLDASRPFISGGTVYLPCTGGVAYSIIDISV